MSDEYDFSSWEEWVECPECESNEQVTISVRPRSVGFWCDNCGGRAFYE